MSLKKLRNLANLLKKDFIDNIPTKEVSKMMGTKEVYICPNCLRENKASSSTCSCGANNLGLEPKYLSITLISKDLTQTADAIDTVIQNT